MRHIIYLFACTSYSEQFGGFCNQCAFTSKKDAMEMLEKEVTAFKNYENHFDTEEVSADRTHYSFFNNGEYIIGNVNYSVESIELEDVQDLMISKRDVVGFKLNDLVDTTKAKDTDELVEKLVDKVSTDKEVWEGINEQIDGVVTNAIKESDEYEQLLAKLQEETMLKGGF